MEGQNTEYLERLASRHTVLPTVSVASVTGMKFGLLSSREMREQSVLRVETTSLYPDQPGLHNARLGTVSKYTPCGTCNQFVNKCSMHFGHIELPGYIIYPDARSKVAKLLTAFCSDCKKANGSMSLHYDDEEINRFANIMPEKRLDVIINEGIKECKQKNCKVYEAPADSIDIVEKGKAAHIPTAVLIDMLNKMDEEDLIKLGVMVYPASLYLFDTIPVPPIQFRAPDPLNGDPAPLTVALRNVLNAVISVNAGLASMQDIVKAYKIYTSTGEEIKINETNESLIGLKSFIDKKEGHMRGNVNGKRTNFCGRTVISPDPSLKLDQIGVPIEMASKLTTQENIFSLNIGYYSIVLEGQRNVGNIDYIRDLFARHKSYENNLKSRISDITRDVRLTKEQRSTEIDRVTRRMARDNMALITAFQLLLVTRGSIKRVTRDGKEIRLTPKRLETFRLRQGDKIHRTLIDGDPITLSRQPSLHKYSLVGGLVVLKPYRTLGLHPSWCTGLNADFDGDEAAINVPQDYQAKADILYLYTIKECMVSEKNGTIINGLIQDAVLGLYLLSQDKTMLTRAQWENAISAADREYRVPMLRKRALELNMNPLSGKVAISCLFPEDFNYTKVYGDPSDPTKHRVVEIVNGILVNGILTKGTISEDDGSILQVLNKSYGSQVATDFQSSAYPMVSSWLSDAGFSFNYSDCNPGRVVESKIRQITNTMREDVVRMYQQAQEGGTAVTDQDKIESIALSRIDSTKARVDKLLLESADVQVLKIDRSGSQNTIGAYCMYNAKGRLVLPHDVIDTIVLNYNAKIAYYTTLTDKDRHPIVTSGLVSVTVAYMNVNGGSISNMTRYWYTQRSFLAMVESKSKGSFNNYSQVAGIVSQQTLSGKRIQRTLANNTVTLPHFEQQVRDPVSEGFVNYGYLHGIPPLQYYIHGIAARQSFIETTVSTPDTGYFTRKLTKLLENNVVDMDGTVRTTPYVTVRPSGESVVVGNRVRSEVTGNERLVGGPIVQFQYGNMGFASNKMISVNGVTTFSNIAKRMQDIRRARESNARYAYVMFVSASNYKEATVSLYALTSINRTEDVIAIIDPSVPIGFQETLRSIVKTALVFDYGDPLWAYNMTDYARVCILDPLLLLVGLIHTRQFNFFESPMPVLMVRKVPSQYIPHINATIPVPLDEARGINDALVIVETSVDKYNYSQMLETKGQSWAQRMVLTERRYGIESVSNISSLYEVRVFGVSTTASANPRGYWFKPGENGSLSTVDTSSFSQATELWDTIQERMLNKYSYLAQYYA